MDELHRAMCLSGVPLRTRTTWNLTPHKRRRPRGTSGKRNSESCDLEEHTNTPWFHGRAHAETAGGLVAGSFGRQDQLALSWAITATIHLTQAISEDRHRGTAQKFCKIHQAWSVYPKDSRAQGSTATSAIRHLVPAN